MAGLDPGDGRRVPERPVRKRTRSKNPAGRLLRPGMLD